jgi:hypothetical protein
MRLDLRRGIDLGSASLPGVVERGFEGSRLADREVARSEAAA